MFPPLVDQIMAILDKVGKDALLKHLKERPAITLDYGTAGFRTLSDNLPSCIQRCALLMLLRSMATKRHVGLMITASHNPEKDNGVKMVDPDGGMLNQSWEKSANLLVNSATPYETLKEIVEVERIEDAYSGVVVLGCDTRKSSPMLAKLAVDILNLFDTKVIDLGTVTTPVLHYIVRRQRIASKKELIDQYYSKKRLHFESLAKQFPTSWQLGGKIIIDCANGVGYECMTQFLDLIHGLCVNRPGDGPLNHECGADYVQKYCKMPQIYSGGSDISSDSILASLDGDADRLVLLKRKADGGGIVLADGDKFACLVAHFLSSHIQALELQLSLVVAQTGYSDGAATAFLESLHGVQVVTTLTGVKNLEKALHDADIGIYWEPNGHGNVICSDKAWEKLNQHSVTRNAAAGKSLRTLTDILSLANETVGDGVLNLLLVYAILALRKKSFDDWMQLYTPRKNKYLKVRVRNKDVVQTVDIDRRITAPTKLKAAVENLKRENVRILIRKSGTEDVIRVFAEASTDELANETARLAARAVWETCDGVGDQP